MGNVKNRENEVYSFIESYIEEFGYPPTVRDICSKLGFSSTSTAQYYLKKLEDANMISFGGAKSRAISLIQKEQPRMIPLIGTVAAGTPIFAAENIEGYYPIPKEFDCEDDMFMLKIKGNSMIEAGICNGDDIIVRKTDYCDDGDIIVALVEDGATCKRFFRRNGKYVLHPENETMSDIILDNVSILGIVRGLIRKIK
ncbi:MAG: transcriptional repressor LexA [Clostridia bacterium]|nr:transcriptional repressor LexA [Clostridia bacterium]